ncbi:MAG: UDP-3-O-[3-hydroxymyristoyl] N-acetylglucosamine deacetylase [Candidatus Omnitrophica bacterium]|nr:UDP-3-O-[3-hydroxymyristoyl] N-acetylglucosamine deacetylase [Candidatus Omnitrophota bacterium]
MKKKTIKNRFAFSGTALQTGEQINVVCGPAEENAGIVFRRTDLKNVRDIVLNSPAPSRFYKRRSTISNGKAEVQTVEHFLAALWALEIDNIIVEVDGREIPALDGSAKEFVEKIKKAGIYEQNPEREFIQITEELSVGKGDTVLKICPADRFTVSYSIDYDIESIGKETFEIELDPVSFELEISPARTFCLKKEAELLMKLGFGKGANYENTLVMDKAGPVGTSLRFPNEPVRHKILDLVGDLYMLGRPIIGRVEAKKTGHKMNAKMVKLLYDKYIK